MYKRDWATPQGTAHYTSGAICTGSSGGSKPNSFHLTTGQYAEIRWKRPKGEGLWTQFWLYSDSGTTDEIDITESSGWDNSNFGPGVKTQVFTLHGGNYSGTSTYCSNSGSNVNLSYGFTGTVSNYNIPDESADFNTLGIEITTGGDVAFYNGRHLLKYVTNPGYNHSAIKWQILVGHALTNGTGRAFQGYMGYGTNNTTLNSGGFLDLYVDYLYVWSV